MLRHEGQRASAERTIRKATTGSVIYSSGTSGLDGLTVKGCGRMFERCSSTKNLEPYYKLGVASSTTDPHEIVEVNEKKRGDKPCCHAFV